MFERLFEDTRPGDARNSGQARGREEATAGQRAELLRTQRGGVFQANAEKIEKILGIPYRTLEMHEIRIQ
jgi:hypothetical protein